MARDRALGPGRGDANPGPSDPHKGAETPKSGGLALIRFVLVLVLIVCVSGVTEARSAQITRVPERCAQRPARTLCAIHFHHDRANRIRAHVPLRSVPYHWLAEARPVLRPRILSYWVRVQHRAVVRLRAARAAPWSASWLRAALCVHHYEGAWNAATGNGYYGGFQFDVGTWLANGGGVYAARADLASPSEQLRIAYRTWTRRGWSPWPNTAAVCGLL